MAKKRKKAKAQAKPRKPRAIELWRAAFRAFFDRKQMRIGKKWGKL